jgi:hypothetical protein
MLSEAGLLQQQQQQQQQGGGIDDVAAAAAAADLACFAGRDDSSYRASLSALARQVRLTAVLLAMCCCFEVRPKWWLNRTASILKTPRKPHKG